jgi:protein phosphatase
VLKGDRYLICSYGQSGVVSADTNGHTLHENADPQASCERLIQLALRGGGPDNITVVIADATDADIVEQAPIVGGAAAIDRGNTTVADSSTPAARASALQKPRTPQPAPDTGNYDREPEQKGHPVRTSLLVLVLLAVLGGGLWLGYRYTQDQYYVGATDAGQLAIFRGVPGQIAGLDLSSVNETSTARLDDLTAVAQERVKQGIHAESRTEAAQTLTQLTDDDPSNPNLKPVCPAAGSVPPVSGSARPVTTTATSAPATAPSVQPSESASTATDTTGCRTAD